MDLAKLYQIELAIQEGVASDQMPPMFKDCLPRNLVNKGKAQFSKMVEFNEFDDDVQRMLMKLRATFKKDYKPDP